MADNYPVTAAEIIEKIKELPADEQVQVAMFIAQTASSSTRRQVSIGTARDRLPVIRVNGGTITSQLVRVIENLTP